MAFFIEPSREEASGGFLPGGGRKCSHGAYRRSAFRVPGALLGVWGAPEDRRKKGVCGGGEHARPQTEAGKQSTAGMTT